MEAGNTQQKTELAKANIQNKIGDRNTLNVTEKMEKTLEPEYKEVLNKTIQYFDKVDEKDYTKENYMTLLKDIYEKNKEYRLLAKYKKCEGNKLSSVCNVDNIVQCQKKCNEIYDCAHVSYNRKKNICTLFNTCNRLRNSYNHNSYTKKSLLRNNGYNIFNAINMNKNVPIEQLPWGIRLATFICGCIIILSVSMIIFKIIKALIKFGLCIYYDNCYYPLELLNPFSDLGPEKRYI